MPQLQNAGSKRYPFTGRIVSIDTPSQTAIIDGDNIPGFMDPMTMTYKIKPAVTLNHLSPGDSISAEVVVVEPAAKSDAAVSDYWLENVKVVAHGKVSHASADNSFHAPAPGEDIPIFPLSIRMASAFLCSNTAEKSCSSLSFTRAVPSPTSVRG